MTTSNRWLKRAILRVSGVCMMSAVETISLIRPTSVFPPVANTTPRPCP